MNPKFLKKVFHLEEKPDFLISEENGHVFKIGEKSGLKQNEFYTINSNDLMDLMNEKQQMNNVKTFNLGKNNTILCQEFSFIDHNSTGYLYNFLGNTLSWTFLYCQAIIAHNIL